MLNLNLNIIGAGGRSAIGAGPDIQPTTTTTTSTTTSTTTTAGPISVRTDPYSASLVYAVPGAIFAGFGQQSFRSDISSYIRGTGTSFTDVELPLSSSTLISGSATGSFAATSGSIKWSGYSTSIEISGSNGSGSLCIAASGTASQFEFPTQDFTIETWINYQNPATGGFTVGSPGPYTLNAVLYRNYKENPPAFGLTGNGIGFQNPGVRFLITTDAGSDIYFDSPQQNRDANTWYHFGAQRSGSLFSSLWNGKAVQSFTYAGAIGTGSADFPFFMMGAGGAEQPGFADTVKCVRYQDYRVYNGVGKYPNATSGSTYTTPDSMIIA